MNYTWQEFVIAINNHIAKHLEDLQVNEDKQVGAFFVKKSDGIMICFEEWSKDIQTCDEAIDYMEKVCNAYTDFLTARSTAVKDVIKRSHRSLSMMISIYVLITLWGLLFR